MGETKEKMVKFEQDIMDIGNSIGIIIPSYFSKQIGLESGDRISILIKKVEE